MEFITVPDCPDEVLVQRSKAGDRAAFELLAARHWPRVRAQLSLLLGDPRDAEEITAETFARASRGLPRFREEATFSTWLHPIAVHLAYNRIRHRTYRQRHESVVLDAPCSRADPTPLIDRTPSGAEAPNDAAARNENELAIRQALQRIAPAHRRLIEMRAAKDLSYGEMADLLGVPEGTVKSRLSRAREALRAQLAVVN